MARQAAEQQNQGEIAQQHRLIQTISNNMDAYEADFAQDHPDYFKAAQHLRTERVAELEDLGYSGDALMRKLEGLGCSKGLVGLVMPTGYTFNTDGSSLYMTLTALFVAQATNTPLTLTQQLTIFAVAMLTSKGASGVQGASFIALVGTLMVVPSIPVAGMALVLGIDRFMSMFRAAVNVIGNAVATIVISRWYDEVSVPALTANLEGRIT